MKGQELVHQARLEGVYSVFRNFQAQHNTLETRCIGSGNCCKVGLFISLGECWNIARALRHQYWLTAESEGIDVADKHWGYLMDDLLGAFEQQSDWNVETQETSKHCVFYNTDYGCGIYEVRPLVCRAYGVTAPVQTGVCPRKRLPDGGIELIRDDAVRTAMTEFDSIIKDWGENNPDLNMSIYMPAGVLKFLLPAEEMYDLIESTPEKFWKASVGYNHQLSPDNWGKEVPVEIGRK